MTADIAFTVFTGEDGKPPAESPHGKRYSAPWENLVASIRAARVFAAKTWCPLLKLGTFRDDYRNNENLEAICGVEGDYDGEEVPPAEAAMSLAGAGIAAMIYTSPSHAPERPRWRALCPLSRPHRPEERARLVARLNGALGGILSAESFTAAQAFYVGRVAGREYAVQEVRGEFLDLLEGLPEIGPRIDSTEVPNEATDDDLRETIRTGRDGVQRALLSLAARFAGRGMPAEDIAGTLRPLMDACEWRERDHDRWRRRYNSIARVAKSAVKKYARRDAEPAPTAAAGMDDAPSPAANDAAIAAAEASVGRAERPGAPEFKPRRPLIKLRDAQPGLQSSYFIKGLFGPGQLALLYGESQSGKTFFGLDMVCHIAAGRAWREHRVRQTGVLYIAAEAGRSIEKRFRAWCTEYLFDGDETLFNRDEADHPLVIVPYAIALGDAAGLGHVRGLIAHVEQVYGFQIGIVVVDTVSRSLAGLDENIDLPKLIDLLDQLRDSANVATLLIHHVGKDGTRGPRGHSSLWAAVDWSGYVAGAEGGAHQVIVDKTRDGRALEQFNFNLRVVVLGEDQDGDPVTTCTIEHRDTDRMVVGERPNRRQGARQSARQGGRPARGPQGLVTASEALVAAIAEADRLREAGTASGTPGTCTTGQWAAEYRRRDNPPAPEDETADARQLRVRARNERFRRASQHLAESGRVVILDDIARFAVGATLTTQTTQT